jgi:hypothetical protein
MHVRGEDRDRFDRLNANGAEKMQVAEFRNAFMGRLQGVSPLSVLIK